MAIWCLLYLFVYLLFIYRVQSPGASPTQRNERYERKEKAERTERLEYFKQFKCFKLIKGSYLLTFMHHAN